MKNRDKLLTALLIVVTCLNFIDVLTDSQLGVPLWHIVEESIIVAAAGFGAFFLILENRRRRQYIGQLKRSLADSDQQNANLSAEMRQARHDFAQVIQHQFSDWQLTASESEVAMLLLKGLSFREISAVRDSTEKTVRQHASRIYEKAGIDGRHALAAWFLEDLVNANAPASNGE
ncbi:LuxR C-terminal-related transcriptional regulator [Aestuariibacter halophilus]|uniref:LuxR C-terminal-related transcriptional regulator n=1 Tax=Fluctibacter halophilus TaxID=226011 RepID=A0ABS8GAH1_9ALTE|nr:LuxR C-terminal-related transcriptional regulator [Aestuariibacter halophilus]MCC2617532.1 LuxR C-terminal-related transcriptional regulator [Aestuariibacter halophilus]